MPPSKHYRTSSFKQVACLILLTVSCVVVFLNAKIYVFVLYKMAFHFLMFNLERHQKELFSPGQLQWFLPPMEVIKLKHPTKSSLWRSDDGLISEKSKAEIYLGSMESKHTTRFTRKKRAKK
jgi:hypothetical protein